MSQLRIEYTGIVTEIIQRDVVIWVGQYEQRVSAKWDCGATRSVITRKALNYLPLPRIGQGSFFTAESSINAEIYNVNLSLSDDISFTDLSVPALNIDKQGIAILIGMDIISKGRFCIDNTSGNTVMTFYIPDKEE